MLIDISKITAKSFIGSLTFQPKTSRSDGLGSVRVVDETAGVNGLVPRVILIILVHADPVLGYLCGRQVVI